MSLIEKAIKRRIRKHIPSNSDSEESSNDEEDNMVLPSDSEEDNTHNYVSNGILFYLTKQYRFNNLVK